MYEVKDGVGFVKGFGGGGFLGCPFFLAHVFDVSGKSGDEDDAGGEDDDGGHMPWCFCSAHGGGQGGTPFCAENGGVVFFFDLGGCASGS